MQKFLQKEQLAREEHILYIPGAKIFEIRAEQDLPKLALPTTDGGFSRNRVQRASALAKSKPGRGRGGQCATLRTCRGNLP